MLFMAATLANIDKNEQRFADVPQEVQDKMTQFYMNVDFANEASKMEISFTPLYTDQHYIKIKQKLALGQVWQNVAGPQYKYYMVFQSKDLHLNGAVQFDNFIELLKEM